MDHILCFFKQSGLGELLRRFFPGLFQGQPFVPRCEGVHSSVFVNDLDLLQVVSLSHEEVIGVVGRGYLHTSRAEFRIDHYVLYDGNFSPPKGNFYCFPRKGCLFRSRMDCNGNVSPDGFGTGGGYDYISFSVNKGIADMVELPLPLLMLHLNIRECRVAPGTPVYDVFPLVYEPLLVQSHKNGPDCP